LTTRSKPLIKDIRAAARLFASARWAWLAAALLLQFSSYASLTWLNVLTLRPFPGRIGFWRLMLVLTTMAFITSAVPSAGASGFVLRARLLSRNGYAAESSTFSMLLELLYQVIGTLLIGLFGLGYLLKIGTLSLLQILLLGVAVVVVSLALWLGWRLISHPRRSLRIVERLAGVWNRLAARLRWKALDPESVRERLDTFQRGLRELGNIPRWKFFLSTLVRILPDVASLGACFAMLGYMIRPDILLLGYSLLMIISALAILPGGLGLADVSVMVIFNRFGVPGSVALAAGLAYRLLSFWLVRFIGFVAWQLLESRAGGWPKARKA
jgi:uncharacterized protein (TIRG00374 family)